MESWCRITADGVPRLGLRRSNICTAVEASKEACRVGCCNELNADYAADGYARTKGIPNNFTSNQGD